MTAGGLLPTHSKKTGEKLGFSFKAGAVKASSLFPNGRVEGTLVFIPLLRGKGCWLDIFPLVTFAFTTPCSKPGAESPAGGCTLPP